MELSEIREKIDAVDQKLLPLLLERMHLAEEVAYIKKEKGLPIYNAQREREILDRISREAGDYDEYAKKFFLNLFELSRSRQNQLMFADMQNTDQEKVKKRINIVLIGMPGSGKTTMGEAVAAEMERPFYDTDHMITWNTGMEILEIFDKYGEAAFREMETKAVREAAKHTGAVIAVGGGAPLREENRMLLRPNAWVCLLERPVHLLERTGRPLSLSIEVLEKMEAERSSCYHSFADAFVSNTDTIKACVEKIIKAFP